ncbi:leukotriene A-4 hydrolase [Trichonephila inaurata madagascariensis]|uniref:Leukotriene A(4) hydrolase n=1 Tax=Trichonephila inaurata madagascariensis TaxID=2747483 RepID=A0A8X7BQF6_9ARAC|nr:leukotriene A-4 hydrolase [Trichonephila inaurata madagascariensis]
MAERLSENDPNSFSNSESVVITDIDLHLEVDFAKHILAGYVDLSLDRKNMKADLFLDTRDLTIHAVKNKNNLNRIGFTLDDPVGDFGAKLEIKLPKRGAKKMVIRIEYETSSNASGLQWLEPEQTAGKKQPYMFSMCQAIHARSIFPCQDTPGVKAPYTATITAPYELVVLMSAVRDGEDMADDPLMKSFKFVQKIPIPSYLFAIAVGAFESKQIGPRTHVWTEKEFVDRSAEEFSETEQMLKCAEDLLGDYVWEVYDLLVLPPSFSFGGMENPCLTFLTPTLLAGDKSLVPCIAHEIAHSWTGNLVTNKNFEHFWLNEGFTTFFERKIVGRMHGEAFRHFECIGGWTQLECEVKHLGEKHDFTKLVPDLKGVDPDEAFSSIPYEKGQALLFYLESILGGPEVFEKFLKAYVEEFKYKSIDTDTWKDYLYKHFSDKEEILNKVDWDTWLYSPGLPPIKPKYDYSMAEKCLSLSKAWLKADDNDLGQFTYKDIENFSSPQVREFLGFLEQEEPMSIKKVEKLNEVYKVGERNNAEIKFRWIRICLKAHWKDIIPDAVQFITEQGRMKFVRPIYRCLYEWDESRELAVSTYKEHSPEMMHATRQGVGRDLHLISEDKKE